VNDLPRGGWLCDSNGRGSNRWMDQDETWHEGRPRPRPHCVRWGPSSPQKGHSSPQFWAHICCCQTVGCLKMPLGTKVGLGPGHIVVDGDPALHPKREHSPFPNFRPMSIVAKQSPISATAEHLFLILGTPVRAIPTPLHPFERNFSWENELMVCSCVPNFTCGAQKPGI